MIDEINKEQELNSYIKGWMTARYDNLVRFHKDTSMYKTAPNGIYSLKGGSGILDTLNNIEGNISEYLLLDDNQSLIPTKFSSVSNFLQWLTAFDNLVNSRRTLLEQNLCGEDTSNIVFELLKILDDIHGMKHRCLSIYQEGQQIPIPYQKLMRSLHENNIDAFIDLMKYVIKDVPYLIRKETVNEGYFHTLFHVITSVLGFSPISEKATNDGRMDVRIETPTTIFIMEFKYSNEDKDLSQKAFQQLIDNGYADPDKLGNKPVIGIGISFSKTRRNINGFHNDILFEPAYSLLKNTNCNHSDRN